MNSRTRISWMKWHAYLSCVFLPFALLYATTGILYLFDIKGSAANKYETIIPLTAQQVVDFPETESQARAFIQPYYSTGLPEHYFHIKESQGWWDFHQEVILLTPENQQTTLIIEENDIVRQLIFIHKGIAGDVFKVLGILLGFSLLFSLISGVVVALAMPKMKKPAMQFIAGGMMILLVAYFMA